MATSHSTLTPVTTTDPCQWTLADPALSPTVVNTRTPNQALRIVQDSIEILKSDVAKAEALRLKARRLKEERNCDWNQSISDLKTFREELQEDRVIAELLAADLGANQKGIHEKEWSCRLAGETTERVRQLEESIQRKKRDLVYLRELEGTRKKTLQGFMISGECSKVRELHDGCKYAVAIVNGGAGDVRPQDEELDMDLDKVTRAYEEVCQEREAIEEEIRFGTSKVKDMRSRLDKVTSEVKLMTADLHVKERQLKEAEMRIAKGEQVEGTKEQDCKEAETRYLEAENLYLEADEHVRTIKKLFRQKMTERSRLEEIVHRENEIKKLKQFSRHVEESMRIPIITEHYPEIVNQKTLDLLNRIVKASPGASPKTPFWTDDLESLTIGLEPKEAQMSKKEVTEEACRTRRSKRKSKKTRNSLLDAKYEYQPPPTLFDEATRKDKGPQIRTVPFSFRYYKVNRVAPYVDNGVVERGKVRKIQAGSNGRFMNILIKVSNYLASANYPKILVVNGVMFRLRDPFSTPEKVYGPLTLPIFRRHEADRRNYAHFHQTTLPYRIFKRFMESAVLGRSQHAS